jgi:hypothetical protein
MARKRRKAPRIRLHPMFLWLRGKMGKIVYRLTRNGDVSAYPAPDMTKVVWSEAQKAHRRHFAECAAYAKLAVRDPDIRPFYVEMAAKSKRSKGRPYDMALQDYHNGNDMLWLKLYGDQEKPEGWSWETIAGT